MTAQFRIGGHYRDGNGNLCAVLQHAVPGRIAVRFVDESDQAVARMSFDHDAVSGQYLDSEAKPVASSYFNLVPGELHNVNGQWVPVAEEAPKTAITPSSVPGYGFDAAGHVVRTATPERQRKPLAYRKEEKDRAVFDPFGGFFTEPADIADWQDTYFPR